MTIKETLQKATETLNDKKISSARLDAEILLLHTLAQSPNKPKSFNNDRSWFYAHDNHEVAKTQENKFYNLIKRRAKFEPAAYITGKKEFFGLNFYVDKNVLIPRPETEILVEESLKYITWRSNLQTEVRPPSANKKIIIADIGTGSGAIAVSVEKYLQNHKMLDRVKIYATDVSANALKTAEVNEKNIIGKSGKIFFRRGNLWQALPEKIKFDFVLANLPYLPDSYPKNIKEYLKRKKITPAGFKSLSFEPKPALTDGKNGISLITNLIISAGPRLKKESRIFLESDPWQIPVIKILAKKYLPKSKISVIKDLRRLDRVTKIEIY